MGAITYINPSQVKAIVSAEVAPLLLAAGFTPIDPFKFVRSAKAPIREVVLVGFGKSDCSIACGWSLSFVPHLQGEGALAKDREIDSGIRRLTGPDELRTSVQMA